jgi:glycosyltransferase involved in cell wall biosynthesis
MKDMPLVSVIIPTYNHGRWIKEAVDSVFSQTYRKHEIIVIDDGSTDDTGIVLRKRYGDRIIYRYQTNQGRGAARNVGLHIAKGKYIQFLDADDLILSEKLEKQVKYLEDHHEVAAVYGHSLLFYEDEIDNRWDNANKKRYLSGDKLLGNMISEPFMLPSPSLVKKAWIDSVGGFDESLKSNEDWDLWLRLAKEGAYFQYYPEEPVALFRQRRYNPPSIIHPQSAVIVLEKLRKDVKSRAERKELGLRRAICEARFEYGGYEALVGNKWKGIVEIIRSLPGKPTRLPMKLTYITLLPLLPSEAVRKCNDRIVILKNAILKSRGRH